MYRAQLKISFLTFCLLIISVEYSVSQSNQSDVENARENFLDGSIDVGLLIRSGGAFTIIGEELNGGRQFQLDAARIDFTGVVDEKIFYRLDLGIGEEMDYFEAYAGYTFSDRFQIKAGAMRPFVSRDLETDLGELEFINRAGHSKVMMNPREVGITLRINYKFLNSDFGVYNGNGHLFENDNYFYYAGRISTLLKLRNKEVQFGGVGSLNMSRDMTVGNSELISSGLLYVFGGFFELTNPVLFFKSEFLQSRFDVLNLGGSKEIINGIYTALGVQLFSRNQFLIRLDYLDYSVLNRTTELVTIGWNHNLSDNLSLMINFMSQFDSDWEGEYGVALKTQLRL